MRCILFTLVSSLGVNATKPKEFLGFGKTRPVYSCVLIGCECNQTIGILRVWWDASCLLSCVNAARPCEFLGFGEMHPVHYRALIRCQCSQNIWIPRVWLDTPCSLSRSDLVSTQPSHRNSYGLARCILFIIAFWFGVNAAKPMNSFGLARCIRFIIALWFGVDAANP